MTHLGGPAQPSPTIGDAINGGYPFLEAKCRRCETHATVFLGHIKRPAWTPIWQLEASLTCKPCGFRSSYPARGYLVRLRDERSALGAWHPTQARNRS